MAYDAVLIDLYETFARSGWSSWQRRFAARLGVSREAMFNALKATRPARSTGANPDIEGDLSAVMVAAGIEPTPELVAEAVEMDREMGASVRLYDDSLDVVRGLRARGASTALVSNCSHNTRPIVARLGLEQEFDAVVLSFEVGAMKPDPAIYRAALSRLDDPEPGRSVFVDDQVEYCDGAAALGMQTFVMLREEEALTEPPVDLNGHRPIETLRPLLDPDA
jgi:putative hydrolase of the HAD superfamily